MTTPPVSINDNTNYGDELNWLPENIVSMTYLIPHILSTSGRTDAALTPRTQTSDSHSVQYVRCVIEDA